MTIRLFAKMDSLVFMSTVYTIRNSYTNNIKHGKITKIKE